MSAYLAGLRPGKIVLWCYLLWWTVTVIYYFDASLTLWLNALGISLIIGFALLLSVGGGKRADRWQTFRLFLTPFCVSSFSALIKDRGFFLIAPPRLTELGAALGICAAFVLIVLAVKYAAAERVESHQ